MIIRPQFYFAAGAILAGCAARPLPALTSTHPASPSAAEAPAPPTSVTLSPAEGLPIYEPSDGSTRTDQRTHEMSTARASSAAASYTCPMHPEIRAAQPGRCPKCGMTLIEQTGDHSASGSAHAH